MRRIDAGTSGTPPTPATVSWDDLKLERPWPAIINALGVPPAPRPVQSEALAKHRILEHRRNLLVSAPTNGGKSLVGTLVMLEAVRRGRRAVLVEPLRALAHEKAEELEMAAGLLTPLIGRRLTVRVSTGDYRLEGETFADSPPEDGEVIVATPERLESIFRRPAHQSWLSTIGAVCVDEAHLIGTARRGPVLEYLITSLLCAPSPPRLVLLSATLGVAERAIEWLTPCDLVSSDVREPPLTREVLELDQDEDADAAVCDFVSAALRDEAAGVLVFVYQTRSAERLAEKLRDCLGGEGAALAYHSQMPKEARERVRRSFAVGDCRCVVATTALALGVNLPASHVIVRDSTFPGVGRLSVADLLQMTGRAGRGNREGHAVVFVRQAGGWGGETLASELREQKLPPLTSAFENVPPRGRGGRGQVSELTSSSLSLVAAHLARRPDEGFTGEELEIFFARSLGGVAVARGVRPALDWLCDTARALAYRKDDGHYRLTAVGRAAAQATLPPKVAAGYAGLIRDLLVVDPSDALLVGWTPIDHLIVLVLLSDNSPSLRAYSSELADRLRGWMETPREGHVSVLYREWIAGEPATSRAPELLGSLGLSRKSGRKGAARSDEGWAHRAAHLALLGAVVIYDRGAGASFEDLTRRWSLGNLEGVEERWRDNLLWLLSGVAHMLEVPCFYYHLREECGATQDRIKRVKSVFRKMRAQVFELRERLKYCSPLGSLLLSIRRTVPANRTRPGVGAVTIRRLEAAGVRSFADLAQLELEDLIRLGVRRDFAKQIKVYAKRRAL